MNDPNTPSRIAASVGIAAFIGLSLYLAPAVVSAMIGDLGFKPAEPGFVISAEMAGMGLATFPALWWIRRLHWGRLAAGLLLFIAIGDAASMFARTALMLATVRFITGLAQGSVSIICVSALRLTRNPNRSFGIWLFGELAVGALALLAMPSLISKVGIAGFYGVLGALALSLALVGRHIASGHERAQNSAASSAPSKSMWVGIAGLGAILAFYVGFSAMWTFASQMISSGVDAATAARALSLAPLGGMAGAALAGALGMRLGAAGPFGIATTVLGVAALTLGTRPGWFAYEMACGGVLMGWTFGIPFLFGGIARVDASGRLTTAINIIIGAGLAAGPAVGALMVDSTGHYGQVVYLTIGVMALSFVLALPMLRAGATNG